MCRIVIDQLPKCLLTVERSSSSTNDAIKMLFNGPVSMIEKALLSENGI